MVLMRVELKKRESFFYLGLWAYSCAYLQYNDMEQTSLIKKNEKFLAYVDKHFIVYLEEALIHLLGIIVCIGGIHFFSDKGALFFSYGSQILIFLILIFWTSFFYVWTKTYGNRWYITNKRIIAVNQKEIMKQAHESIDIDSVDNIFFEKDGLFQSWFGYGKLCIESRNPACELVIDSVRDVEDIARIITVLQKKAKKKAAKKEE